MISTWILHWVGSSRSGDQSMQAEPCRRSLACAGDSRARQGKGALVRACAVDRRLSQFHTQQRMACAEFRKFRLDLDTGSNIYERKHIPDPPGYDPNIAREQGEGAVASRKQGLSFQKRQEAVFSKSWAPLKQIGMLAFMMWMSGSQLHLFSIMTTISGIYQPLTAILKSGEVFPPDPEGKLNTFIPRLLYCLINGGGLAFAGYRINQMGLLPTHLSDWVSSIKAPQVLEHAAGGLLQGHS